MKHLPATAWKTLLATPTPPKPQAASSKAALLDRREVNMAMWSAIDRNQIQEVREAVEAGASLANRRDGQTALWRAVANGQWDIAEFLRERGADIHTKTQSHQTLFSALVGRDDPTEAERLLAWGCDPTQTQAADFLAFQGAPRLLQWWLEHGNMHKIPGPKTDTNATIAHWAKVAMHGTPRLRAYLNKVWGVDARNPWNFSTAFRQHDNVDQTLWNAIIQKDDVELARACLESGWGFAAGSVGYCWRMAHGCAWHLLEWFRQVPVFHRQMMDLAQTDPGQTWWKAAKQNLPSLERVLALGVDIQQQDGGGRTIAHEALSVYDLKRPIVQWFADHHPEMLDQRDGDGKTPMDHISTPQLRTQMEAIIMKKRSPKATAKQSTTRRL